MTRQLVKTTISRQLLLSMGSDLATWVFSKYTPVSIQYSFECDWFDILLYNNQLKEVKEGEKVPYVVFELKTDKGIIVSCEMVYQ